jgi:hypothetical protein
MGAKETGFQKIMNGLLRGEIAPKKAKSRIIYFIFEKNTQILEDRQSNYYIFLVFQVLKATREELIKKLTNRRLIKYVSN